LVIDEFAAHKDADLLMSLAQPIIMAGGSMSVLSTHRSRNSRFNEIVLDSHKPDTQWSRHRTTIYDAVEAGLVEEIINPNMIKLGNEPWKSRQDFLDWLIKSYDTFTFQQEFCCVPSDDATSLLIVDEVNGAKLHMESLGHLKKGAFYVGYDCAESIFGDFATCFVIRADDKNQVDLVDKRYFERGTPISEQIDTVVETVRKYHARKLVSDNAGIGRHPTTILGEKLGESIVVPFDPTLQSKGEMCTKVKRYFQNGWVRMEDDKRVEEDFLSIDRLITPSNNVVYHANRTGAIGHGDGFSAFAMALTEVPELNRSEIKGIKGKKADPFDVVSGHEDRVERNRRNDSKSKRKSSY